MKTTPSPPPEKVLVIGSAWVGLMRPGRRECSQKCSHTADGSSQGELLAPLVEEVDLKAEEMHVAFAIADGGLGVGLVRKPTNESDWRDVPLIDSEGGANKPAWSLGHLRGRPRPDEADPTGLDERSACRGARPLECDAPGPLPLRRDDHA